MRALLTGTRTHGLEAENRNLLITAIRLKAPGDVLDTHTHTQPLPEYCCVFTSLLPRLFLVFHFPPAVPLFFFIFYTYHGSFHPRLVIYFYLVLFAVPTFFSSHGCLYPNICKSFSPLIRQFPFLFFSLRHLTYHSRLFQP